MRIRRDLAPDRPGRRSGIKRFVYRRGQNESAGDGAKPGSQTAKDWSAIKDQLRRTVRRVPEVVITVRGSRNKGASDGAAVESVLRYMLYISRHGRLQTIDQAGERIEGTDAIREKHVSWDLDMQRMRSSRGEALHPSFNIIFSMPARTDPNKLLQSVQAFARDHYARHEYVMALHTPETEPGRKKDKSPEHPHVHLILRAEDQDGQRIYIRKGTLRAWREAFAAQLRAHGIEANASSRAERGISFKKMSNAEWHISRRYEDAVAKGDTAHPPTAKVRRVLQAAQELGEGRTEPKPWELAMAARRRDVLRELSLSAARLREEGDHALADQIERFMQEMPPVDSERRKIQRLLLEQLNKRQQARELNKERDLSK